MLHEVVALFPCVRESFFPPNVWPGNEANEVATSCPYFDHTDKSSEMRRESSSAVAEERAELTGGTAPAGERNLKKKNKRSGGHSGATVEGTPSSVTEEGRGLEAAAVAVSTDKQRRKLRTGAREDHTSSSSTESGSSLVCEEMATEAERSDLPSVKRRRRGSGGTVPGDRSDLVVSEARTAVEGSRLTRGKEAVGSRDGGEGLAEERTVEGTQCWPGRNHVISMCLHVV